MRISYHRDPRRRADVYTLEIGEDDFHNIRPIERHFWEWNPDDVSGMLEALTFAARQVEQAHGDCSRGRLAVPQPFGLSAGSGIDAVSNHMDRARELDAIVAFIRMIGVFGRRA